jgi:hypothetical protein
MSARLSMPDASGAVRDVALPDVDCALAARGDGVELGGIDIADAEVRIVRTRKGLRLEPVRAGSLVSVSGQDLFCKDLAHGDWFSVGGHRVSFVADAAASNARAQAVPHTRRSSATSDVERAEAPQRVAKTPSRTSPVLIGSLVSLALLCAFVLFRFLDAATSGRDPKELLTFASIQLENGQYARARATIEDAMKDGDPDIRRDGEALRSRIDAVEREALFVVVLQTAREEDEALRSFVDRYARPALERPAARELLSMCDAWLSRHEAQLARHASGDALLRSVRSLRETAVANAQLDQPESAQDAAFAARARLRFMVREYKAAILLIDTFLATHPGDAVATAERAAILAEGKEWIDKQQKRIAQHADRGEWDRAREELAKIDRHALLPEWESAFVDVRARIAADQASGR